MIYSAALEAISKLENGAELIDAVKAEVNDKGKENKSLRDRLKGFGDRTADTIEAVFAALDAVDIDVSGDVAEQLKAIGETAGKKTETDKQLATLQKQVTKLTETLTNAQTENAEILKKTNLKTLESALAGAFTERVLNPSVTLKYHISNGDFVLNEAGQAVYKSADGTEEIITKGNIDKFLKDNPDAAKNTQQSGAGSTPKDKGGDPNAGGGENKTFTIEQVKAMSPAEVAKNYDAVHATLAAQSAD